VHILSHDFSKRGLESVGYHCQFSSVLFASLLDTPRVPSDPRPARVGSQHSLAHALHLPA
jgi:hypothetical protein